MDRDQEHMIIIGKTIKAHGLKGWLKVVPLTDVPGRFQPKRPVILESQSGEQLQGTLTAVKGDGQHVLIQIRELSSMDEAQRFVRGWIKVHRTEAGVLPKHRFYHHELIGLDVFFESLEWVGTLCSIMETGSNDVWVVQGHGREVLIPAIHQVVKEVDLTRKRIIVNQVEGLVEANAL